MDMKKIKAIDVGDFKADAAEYECPAYISLYIDALRLTLSDTVTKMDGLRGKLDAATAIAARTQPSALSALLKPFRMVVKKPKPGRLNGGACRLRSGCATH